MPKIKFVKMQGCGNDYVYFDCIDGVPEELSDIKIAAVARRLSDRHFGVGGDGIVLICKSNIADAKMRMFNADGSEGAMCGNATRCIGKYLFDHGYLTGDKMTLDTKSGVKTLKLNVTNGICVGASVFMGEVTPMKYVGGTGSGQLVVGGARFDFFAVDAGNPHAVFFVENVTDFPVGEIGPVIEKDGIFKNGVNAEFVRGIGENALEMRVWERGSGETLACGTGSCAAAYAAVSTGVCSADKPITVKLLGGEISVEIRPEGAYMTGPAAYCFEGEADL